MDARAPLIIVGGGLAGALAALLLTERRPDMPVLLLESGDHFGGNHTWSFFDSDVPQSQQDVIAALSPIRWTRHRVSFPARNREIDMAYNSVSSSALDALVRERIPEQAWRTGAKVAQMNSEGVTLMSGESIAGRGVIDARGPMGAMPGLQLGWQNFVGIEFAAAAPEPDCATIMDACLPQLDGYRFIYVLPMAADRVLVEDTYYSNSPDLDVEQVSERVREQAKSRGLHGRELRLETGVLPIMIDGDPEILWPVADQIGRLGLMGGFFHPTTGYSFGLAVQMADKLSRLPGDFSGERVAHWTREQFMQHWNQTRFYRMLNRMLFRAAASETRYRIFEHFYRLPAPLIGRFYAGTLTLSDKMRILSGKPPVPIGHALRALIQS